MPLNDPVDGFWLPERVRSEILNDDTPYCTVSFAAGRECGASDTGAVTVRWPILTADQWEDLVGRLQSGRRLAPRGVAVWERLQSALSIVARRFADPSDPLHNKAVTALPSYTGYSEQMIRLTLGALDMMSLEDFPAAMALSPRRSVSRRWETMAGLPGRVRFFERSPWRRLRYLLPGDAAAELFEAESVPSFVVGYGAGNVPGTALLISLLSQATALTGQLPPAAVVKNSRREPIFSPLVLRALEEADPDLFASLAVMIWDYSDESVQDRLLSHAELVIAAASDETIAEIRSAMDHAVPGQGGTLHGHGHKVSFSAIGREILEQASSAVPAGQSLLDMVALLAALDSVFWDQHGCLSSRVHFVETGDDGLKGAEAYAERLAVQMRSLSTVLPRGAWPRQQIYDQFDRYNLLEATGKVRVLSDYDDQFVVALDGRSLDSDVFARLVNDCMGRVIIVRPVQDLMRIPIDFLGMIPAGNLQSLSVALGRPTEGLTPRFLRFAAACGQRGVTAIRTVGRGAFPQLAYSWDGWVPLDLIRRRPPGWFTTIEFDAPFDEMLATFQLFLERGESLGLSGG